MKLAATVARSLQADMQAELRDIERAVATGTREAGRGLKTELRRQVSSAGLGQRLANSWRDKHYPNQQLDAASLVYTKAPQIIRASDEGAEIRSKRGRFFGDPNRERTEERHRRQAHQPEHLPGEPLRATPVRASAPRAVASGRRGVATIVQSQDRRAAWVSNRDRSGAAQRAWSDHGCDVPARTAGDAAEGARRRSRGGARVSRVAAAGRAAARDRVG
jgi:hypothetical protein